MKKKVTVKPKVSPAKTSKNKPVKEQSSKGTMAKKPILMAVPPRPAPPLKASEDPKLVQVVKDYEQALKALQAQKYDRAKPLLEKVIAAGSKELSDRAGMHLNICNQQLAKTSQKFGNAAEQYDYAVSLMNMGDYVGAREQLEKLLKNDPKLDYVWYGFSVLECMTGHFPEALQHLTEAIRLNPANRFQARNDTDFQNLADDPRFTELLYPEGASV
jgi:tetratricopeptide (TPR) repeat protein